MSGYVRKNPPANYITLIDGGYWVRFTAIRNGKQVNLKQKTFRFTQYNNDPIEAKAAAEKWVKYWAPRLKKPQSCLNRKKLYRKRSKSSTGISGVTRSIQLKNLPSGNVGMYCSYVVSWSETVDGKRKHRKKHFQFDPNDKSSEKLAKEKAIEYRREMERLHYEGGQDTK